jgi:hypothetical protein
MTPKEKAKELIHEFYPNVQWKLGQEDCLKRAKNCALITVDKIDDIYQKLTPKDDPYYFLLELEYWQEVKQEIENYETKNCCV